MDRPGSDADEGRPLRVRFGDQVAISPGIVVLLYTSLGVIAAVLMVRHARRGLPSEPAESPPVGTDRRLPSLTY